MSEAVELHDSDITAIHHAGSDVVVELVAIVHSSEGRPGWDPGKTGTQPAELVIEAAHIASTPTSLPLSILSGRVSVDAHTLENVLPLPFDMAGDVRLELSGAEGTFSAKGDELGSCYVEPGSTWTTFDEALGRRYTECVARQLIQQLLDLTGPNVRGSPGRPSVMPRA